MDFDSDLDSDSDAEDEAVTKEQTSETSKDGQDDIQELVKIQEAEKKKKDGNVTKSTQEQKTTQESLSMRNDHVLSSVSVSTDHSYSLSHRTTAGGISVGDKQGVNTDGAKSTTTTSQVQGTSAIKDASNACQDKSASNSQSTSQSSSVGETNQLVTGYDIHSSQISHSKWLILQGHCAKGIMGPGKNIQDNTLVNACTVTVQKVGMTQPRDTLACRGDSVTHQSLPYRTSGSSQQTLLWDFKDQDDGRFTGFKTHSDLSSHILGRDNVLNMKWSDVNAMIQG